MEPLFCIEHHYMPKQGYSHRFNDYQRAIARNAISSCLSHHYTDDFTFYLAMNYFDRFVSRCSLEELSRELESEAMIRTSAICCLILALKMITPDFSLSGFLISRNLVQSINRIRETEYLILKVLDWRMQPITAWSFLNVFIENLTLYDPKWMIRPSILQNEAIANICYSQSTIKLTEFRPSVIAAAAIIITWMTNFSTSYYEVCIARTSFGNHYEHLHHQGLKQCVLLMIDKMGLRVPSFGEFMSPWDVPSASNVANLEEISHNLQNNNSQEFPLGEKKAEFESSDDGTHE